MTSADYKPQRGDSPVRLLAAVQREMPYSSFCLDAYNGSAEYTATDGSAVAAPGRLRRQAQVVNPSSIIQVFADDALDCNYEIAVTCNVADPVAASLRIGMADLACSRIDSDTAQQIHNAFGGKDECYFYCSGNSFHVYCPGYRGRRTTMAQDMAGLLLIKPTDDGKHVVDVRWVGNCLQRGYAALRLTARTKRHYMSPKFVGTATELMSHVRDTVFCDEFASEKLVFDQLRSF